MVANVDSKIKKSLARAENPIQGNNRVERQQIEQASIYQNKMMEDPQLVMKRLSKNPGTDPNNQKMNDLSSNQPKQPELTQFQKEQLYQRIDQLEQKIDFFITNAQKQGEEGNIEESEAIMLEVEKHRVQKKELEGILVGEQPGGQGANPNEGGPGDGEFAGGQDGGTGEADAGMQAAA